MTELIDCELTVVTDPSGQRTLKNMQFVNNCFSEIYLGPSANPGGFVVENCSFKSCVVGRGRFVVRDGVVLRKVIIDDVKTHDALTIYTTALLDQVTLRGGGSGVWIKPPERVENPVQSQRIRDWVEEKSAAIDVMLDISNYEAQVDIFGLPPAKVITNTARHVVISRKWTERNGWKELGLSDNSYWEVYLSRLDLCKVSAAVTSMPKRSYKRHAQAMQELEALKKAGVAS